MNNKIFYTLLIFILIFIFLFLYYLANTNSKMIEHFNYKNNWFCFDEIPYAIKQNKEGNIKCMSIDGKKCLENTCIELINNPPKNLKPLVCGEEHRKLYSDTGYHNIHHWCYKGKKKFNNIKVIDTNNMIVKTDNIEIKELSDLKKEDQVELGSNILCKMGKIKDIGNYRYHIFDEIGTQEIEIFKNGYIDILVIGGGGAGASGGNNWPAGGGGAGGVIHHPYYYVMKGKIQIKIGRGGFGNKNRIVSVETSGENSIFKDLNALGGGSGGYGGPNLWNKLGNGGSGGGSGGGAHNRQNIRGGYGLQKKQKGYSGIYGYGNNGGSGGNNGNNAGGGGGATQNGQSNRRDGAKGGDGILVENFKNIIYEGHDGWFAGGGGATIRTGARNNFGIGGKGGGGNSGKNNPRTNGINGKKNTGSGGGASKGNFQPGNGGSGIIIFRYPLNIKNYIKYKIIKSVTLRRIDNRNVCINLGGIDLYDHNNILIKHNITPKLGPNVLGNNNNKFGPQELLTTGNSYSQNRKIAHTIHSPNAFAQIILDTPQIISKIVIRNRIDKCCIDRIIGTKLFVNDIQDYIIFEKQINDTKRVYEFELN